jgi:hypothetical protein
VWADRTGLHSRSHHARWPSFAAIRSHMVSISSMIILLARGVLVLTIVSCVFAIIGTVSLNPPLDIVSVSGTPTPPEDPTRTVANVLATGDFVTKAPDGEANVTFEFAEPTALHYAEHRYPGATSDPYRVRRAQMEWSDDGQTWRPAKLVNESNGRLRFSLGGAGAHRFWRFVVVESGTAASTVVGNIRLSRSIFGDVPIDLAFAGVWLAALGLIMTVQRT